MKVTERSDTVQYEDVPLHLTIYETDKESPVLIFVPGMTMHAGLFTNLIPGVNYLEALATEGFNVIGVDLQGHGQSGGPRGRFTYQDLMGNMSRVVDYVMEKYNDRVGSLGPAWGASFLFTLP